MLKVRRRQVDLAARPLQNVFRAGRRASDADAAFVEARSPAFTVRTRTSRCYHSGAGWGTGEATAPPRACGDRKDFHRADRSGAAMNVASTSNMPVMRLER